jgi:hypothetical protein
MPPDELAKGVAQVVQRRRGLAKWFKQLSQTASRAQLRQTQHALGTLDAT